MPQGTEAPARGSGEGRAFPGGALMQGGGGDQAKPPGGICRQMLWAEVDPGRAGLGQGAKQTFLAWNVTFPSLPELDRLMEKPHNSDQRAKPRESFLGSPQLRDLVVPRGQPLSGSSPAPSKAFLGALQRILFQQKTQTKLHGKRTDGVPFRNPPAQQAGDANSRTARDRRPLCSPLPCDLPPPPEL